MLPRGRPRERDHDRSNVELDELDSAEEQGHDIHPDSDSALLYRHRLSHESDSEGELNENGTKSGIVSRVITFMSRSPLLAGSSSFGDAAAYEARAALEGRSGDSRGHDTRKARASALRPSLSSASPDAQFRRRSYDISSFRSKDRGRLPRRTSSPMLLAEHSHPAGQGGHLGASLPFEISEADGEPEGGGDSTGFDADDDDDDKTYPIDNSPYPQVRASVSATDNITASINTPRMWVLSLLCAFLGSATNLFFSLRYPSVAITPVIALIIVHPLGLVWDASLKREDDPPVVYEYGTRVSRSVGIDLSRSNLQSFR